MKKSVFAILAVLLLPGSAFAADFTVAGDYLEVRTADVYTAACYANGEVNLAGKRAIMTWRVRQGEWEGTPLAGLGVVAAVQAQATLGDPFSDPLPADAVVIVDERASTEQREALLSLARSMAGELLSNIVAVSSAPIDLQVDAVPGTATMRAGNLATIRTRPLNHHDLYCGNEEVYYPPLISVQGATPAFALQHRFQGEGLAGVWSSPDKRSAFIATFVR